MPPDPSAIAHSGATVSDKIRALANAGVPRAEIARLLGKRYQHVRNVLEAEALKTPRARPESQIAFGQMAEAPSAYLLPPEDAKAGGVQWLEVTADGALTLPGPLKAALGVQNGGKVMAQLGQDGAVTLHSVEAAIERAQALFQKFSKPDVSLVDELIADRRAEALRESQDG